MMVILYFLVGIGFALEFCYTRHGAWTVEDSIYFVMFIFVWPIRVGAGLNRWSTKSKKD